MGRKLLHSYGLNRPCISEGIFWCIKLESFRRRGSPSSPTSCNRCRDPERRATTKIPVAWSHLGLLSTAAVYPCLVFAICAGRASSCRQKSGDHHCNPRHDQIPRAESRRGPRGICRCREVPHRVTWVGRSSIVVSRGLRSCRRRCGSGQGKDAPFDIAAGVGFGPRYLGRSRGVVPREPGPERRVLGTRRGRRRGQLT